METDEKKPNVVGAATTNPSRRATSTMADSSRTLVLSSAMRTTSASQYLVFAAPINTYRLNITLRRKALRTIWPHRNCGRQGTQAIRFPTRTCAG